MEVVGKIYKVGQVEAVGASGFKKREVVIKTDSKYPQTIPVEIVQEQADKFNGKVGQSITATIDIRGREWTSPQGETRFFVSLNCWKWDLNDGTQSNKPTNAMQPDNSNFEESDPIDDGEDSLGLPF